MPDIKDRLELLRVYFRFMTHFNRTLKTEADRQEFKNTHLKALFEEPNLPESIRNKLAQTLFQEGGRDPVPASP